MPLKLIFMGSPHFALPTLQSLVASEHEVMAVYTQPPRPAGRGNKEQPTPVHLYAMAQNIPVFTPVTLKDAAAQEQFRNMQADAAIVAAYGLILPQAILDGTRLGCLNVHPSLLPRWRGAAPIQRTIMAGDKETGVVIMQMNAGLDTGDMLLVQRVPIPDGTTAGQLHDTLAAMAGPMMLETLADLASGTLTPGRQLESGVTYAQKITKEECRIDWKEPANVVRQKILGLSPQPGAYFTYQGESIKTLRAELAAGNGSPGAVLDDRLTIACAHDAIRPLTVQRPGKKPMPAQDMLKGCLIAMGTVVE